MTTPAPATLEQEVEALARALAIVPESWDPKTRRFEMTLSTGARVRRFDWWTGESWDEELSLEAGHVRTERLAGGIAILHEHGFTGLSDAQVGITTGFRFETIKGVRHLVTGAQLSGRKEVEGIADDVGTGVKRHVSVGYKTWQQRVLRALNDGEFDLRTAVDWEPLEGSLVAVPADIGAGVRSAGTVRGGSLVDPSGRPLRNRCVVVISSAAPAQRHEGGEDSMNPPIVPAAPAAVPTSPEETRTAPATAPVVTPPDTRAAEEAAATRENSRQALVRSLARQFKVSDKLVDELAGNRNADETAIRAAIMGELATRQAAAPTAAGSHVTITSERREHVREGIKQALEVRAGLRQSKDLDERGRRMMGAKFVRWCEEYLRADGVELESISEDWILKRAIGMIGTSDLPKLLENIQQKTLQTAYDAIATTWRAVAKIVTATDFKQRSTVHRGLGSKLIKIPETGEIPFGKFAEGGEKYAIVSWGLRVPFTFQAMRNDDLEAITETPRDLGIQAAMNVEETLWAFISGNATMADSVAIFHAASHANDVAGAADFKLSGANAEKGLQEMQRLLRLQTDTDGLTKLGLAGKFLIVPAALDVPARKQTAAILGPTSTAGVNVFNFLTPLVVAQLDGGAQGTDRHYMAADPAVRPVFEVAFLDGNQVPVIDSRDEFSQDGMQWRVRWYWGGVVPNHRGIVRNIGQTA